MTVRAIFTSLGLLACLPGITLAQTPQPEEAAAFYAPLDAGSDAYAALDEEEKDIYATGDAEQVALCDRYTEVADQLNRAMDESLVVLHKFQADGRPVRKLVGYWLGYTVLANTARKEQFSWCANTFIAYVGRTQPYAQYVQFLLVETDRQDTAYRRTRQDGDELDRLRYLEGRYAFLSDAVLTLMGLEAKDTPLVDRMPRLKRDALLLASVENAQVQPVAAEDNAERPYAFTPLRLPPMPADNDAFTYGLGSLLNAALRPGTDGFLLGLSGDTATACTRFGQGRGELQRVRIFVDVYITQQAASGADTAEARERLQLVDELIEDNDRMTTRLCPA